MSSEDHYLTLSITSPGPATLPPHEKRQMAPRDPCNITDIEGAAAQPKYKLYTNKPIFLNSDIPGAQPKQLVRGRNVRDNSLYIDDIDGTRRAIKDRMMRTTRHVNPLEPDYPMPRFVPTEPIEVPFKRDPLNISDIEGTKPKPKKEFAPKSTMDITDIDGARPGLRETKLLNSIETRDILSTDDVSRRNHRYTDKTSRVSDPCAPIYRVHGMEIKDGRESKPRAPPKEMKDSHLLQTRDITGATADTKYASPFPRREYRNTNFIADIEGSHADSIKHSITTNRMTHPLQPVYQSLDPGEMLLPLIPPLIPADLVKMPTLPALDREKSAQQALTKPASSSVSSSAVGANNATSNPFGASGTWDATDTSNNNFASTTGFHFYDKPENDLDPVLFTAAPSGLADAGKPPTGRKSSLALPMMPNSGRDYQGPISGKDRAMNTAGLIFSQRGGSNPTSNQPSARLQPTAPQRTSYGNSPMVSGRGNGGLGNNNNAAYTAVRRAEVSRQEEINMVRQLQ